MRLNQHAAVVGLVEGPKTPRSTKLMVCPFEDCVDHRRRMAPDTLTRHLGRCHVSGGQAIPMGVLDTLGLFLAPAAAIL